jgi:NAD(P)-dependent dehydrogenase (short-subunit alcohol dehydrogenase family)
VQIWFITGASRGLGLEVARLALARGDAVVAAARNPRHVEEAFGGSLPEHLLAVALDVTDRAQVAEAVARATERFARIDVLVNNAGRGLIGAVEEASEEEIRSVFDSNVFGLLAVTRAVLPLMRAQGSGRILNISSVGGFTARSGGGIYAGTKFAVEGVSEALRAELEPLGIQVTIVEPGSFRTDILDPSSMVFSARAIEDYASTAGDFRNRADLVNHQQPGRSAKAAGAIVAVATAEDPPLRLVLGPDAVARIEEKLEHVASDIAAWRELSLSTDVQV